jgi:hypothetical protein
MGWKSTAFGASIHNFPFSWRQVIAAAAAIT